MYYKVLIEKTKHSEIFNSGNFKRRKKIPESLLKVLVFQTMSLVMRFQDTLKTVTFILRTLTTVGGFLKEQQCYQE